MVKTTQNTTSAQCLIDREKLAARWCCSIMTLKRMEKRKLLKRVQLCDRLVRYRLEDVIEFELKAQA